jgi:hypothetical protein
VPSCRRASTWSRTSRAILRMGPPPQTSEVSVETLALVEALRTLPVRQRQVIVLHHLVGLPVEEVAQTLRVPAGTVKSLLSRGRRGAGGPARGGGGGAAPPMSDLQTRLQQAADEAAHLGRIPGPDAVIRRGRQRRRRLIGGTASLVILMLLAGALGTGRLASRQPPSPRPRPPPLRRPPRSSASREPSTRLSRSTSRSRSDRQDSRTTSGWPLGWPAT